MQNMILALTLVLAVFGLVSGKDQCLGDPLATSSNDFASKLIKKIDGRDNVFISPISIYMALSVVYLGARGSSADEIASVFKLKENGLDRDQLKNSIRSYLSLLDSNSEGAQLLLANGLFVEKSAKIEDTFIQEARNFFKADVGLVDFLNRGTASKNAINTWASNRTNGKISKLLLSPLDPNTIMAILNAIYFKGLWKYEFDRRASMDGRFYRSDNSTTRVTYMIHKRREFPFAEVDSYKFVELPYQGDNLKMLLAMPIFEGAPLNLDMTSSMLCKVTNSLNNTKLSTVMIPKLKMEYRRDLKRDLATMGIQDIFTNSADLTGMKKDGGILVSDVKHAAVVEINEVGTEAAAATSVFITRLSISFDPEFIANRPFLFYIIDNRNGLVLFSGRIENP